MIFTSNQGVKVRAMLEKLKLRRRKIRVTDLNSWRIHRGPINIGELIAFIVDHAEEIKHE